MRGQKLPIMLVQCLQLLVFELSQNFLTRPDHDELDDLLVITPAEPRLLLLLQI